jgi:hypothetical protein
MGCTESLTHTRESNYPVGKIGAFKPFCTVLHAAHWIAPFDHE